MNTKAKDAPTMFVDSKLVDCDGEGPMKCIRVRESTSGEWLVFYSRIEGFTHEAGYFYELRVEVNSTAEPPAGGSTRRYRLVEVVSKNKEAP